MQTKILRRYLMVEKVVSARNLTKTFGKVVALKNVSFDVDRGEFFLIIGPSGCGKTTLLRCLAGLETPDSGHIFIGGKNVEGVPTRERDISLVFQNLALFPHKNVYDNIAFGLRMRKTPEDVVRNKVENIMKIFGLEGIENRLPEKLSAGQRQRIALARSTIIGPSVIFFDEPLGNIDYRLRKKLELELKLIHKKLGLTFIYVTHDQEQAMTLATKIMVMNYGVIEQIGSPTEIYSNPSTVFVAKFFGDINMLSGEIASKGNGMATIKTDVGTFEARLVNDVVEKKIAYAIRPEKTYIGASANEFENKTEGKIISIFNKGSYFEYVAQLPNGVEFKSVSQKQAIPIDQAQMRVEVLLGWSSSDALLLEKPSVVPGINIDKVILGA